MIPIQHIVCPVDLSDCSYRALEYAAALADWYESRLTVLHVFANLPVVDAVPIFKGQPLTLHDVDQASLRAAFQDFVGTVPCTAPVTLEVCEGRDPRRGILEQVATLQPDLLVMGTHGRSGFEGLILGSVTERVLRESPCPVITVPPGAAGPQHTGPFKRIVAAVDFSGTSVRALQFALNLAEEADAEITILNVIEIPPELREGVMAANVDVAQIRAAAEAAALSRLRDLVPPQARTFCTVRTEVAEGRASREIVRVAESRQADLIVIGVRGRGAIDRLIFGSNTHSVLLSAQSPVLTVG